MSGLCRTSSLVGFSAFMVIGILWIVSPQSVAAQEGMGLSAILHGNVSGSEKRPTKFWCNTKGGDVWIDIKHSDKFSEQVRFSWRFDRDVRYLPAGSKLAMDFKSEITKAGNEKDDPNKFMYDNPSNYTATSFQETNGTSSLMTEKWRREEAKDILENLANYIDDGGGTIYARNRGEMVPERTITYSIKDQIDKSGRYSLIYIHFDAYSYGGKKESCNYEFVYLFRSNSPGKPESVVDGDIKIPDWGQVSADDGTENGQPAAGPDNKKVADNSDPKKRVDDTSGNPSGKKKVLPPDTPFVQLGPPDSDGTDPDSLTLATVQRVVQAGKIVQIPVYLRNASDVANINFELSYDPQVVQTEADPYRGNMLPANSLFAGNSKQAGVVLAGFAGSQGATGSGTVAEIRFRAVGNPGDISDLTLKVTRIDDPDGTTLPVELIHGRITIVDENGAVQGDCNGDAKIDWRDAMCPLLMSVKKMPEQKSLDVDQDGAVDSRDSVIILQKSLGLTGE